MITIVSYQLTWREEFQTLAETIRREMGNLALRIDHIGSTSVPGLAAKDIIDLQVTVKELLPAVELALKHAGYQRLEHITDDHIPPAGPHDPHEWSKWYFKPPEGASDVHVHVRLAGRANQRYPLLFRDYLRATPNARQAYARVKLALAHHHADDVDAYYDIKDPVCDIIIAAAEAWALQTVWQPGPSDA
jgi:GrpB-like predicted nucleotidyltransferase (UPF0157 family)